jgi:hypothetical protein
MALDYLLTLVALSIGLRANNKGVEIMQRGNLVIYDLEGTIISQTGEAEGDLLPHVYPVGVPYIELPFGSMKYEEQRLVRIDVSQEPHTPIFEPIVREKTAEEKLAEYEAKFGKL